MSIFKYLTLSHLQKVLAALEVRFKGIEHKIDSAPQSDWDENDSSSKSYIQNKTHYKASKGYDIHLDLFPCKWPDDEIFANDITISNETYNAYGMGDIQLDYILEYDPLWFPTGTLDDYDLSVLSSILVVDGIPQTLTHVVSRNNNQYGEDVLFAYNNEYILVIRPYYITIYHVNSNVWPTTSLTYDLKLANEQFDYIKLDNKYLNGKLISKGSGEESEIFNGLQYEDGFPNKEAFGWYSHIEGNATSSVWKNIMLSGQAGSVTYSTQDFDFEKYGPVIFDKELYFDNQPLGVKVVSYTSSNNTITLSNTLDAEADISQKYYYIPLPSMFTGNYSHAEGSNTCASGESSHAEGYNTTAFGNNSHAEGNGTRASGYSSHAEGSNTFTSGNYSHAEGGSTRASGIYSHAEGNDTIVSGYSSHVEGGSTRASGSTSHAEGSNTAASGDTSHAEGYKTIASGYSAHAEGSYTRASGYYSHAEGHLATASGSTSHAEGGEAINTTTDNKRIYLTGAANATNYTVNSYSLYGEHPNLIGFRINDQDTVITNQTVVNGVITEISVSKTLWSNACNNRAFYFVGGSAALATNSHAEGGYTTASGISSHAEGYLATASGESSHAEGYKTIASGNNSHAEGNSTVASGSCSHAEGYNTTVSGAYSHVEGYLATASGNYSHAEGYGTTASRRSHHVFGEYNILDEYDSLPSWRGQYVEIVGNGTANNARSNARTLDWNGNEVLAGKLTVGAAPTNDMDVATKKYVDDATTGITSNLSGLTDTTISSPTNEQILQYNSTTSKWENKNIPSNVFVVNISGTDPDYTSDKTYEEIEAAYNAGKRCICIRSGGIYNLSRIYTRLPAAYVTFSTLLTVSVSSDTGEKKATMESVFINASGTIQVKSIMAIGYSDVLTKYNTESYIPTSDYHPATKKYVDDSIPENNIFITTITSGVSEGTVWYAADKTVNQIVAAHDSGKICFVKYTNFLYPMVRKTNSIAYFMNINSDADAIDGFSISNTVQRIQKNIPQQLSDLSNVSTISPTDGQLLKYNATTSKWENVILSLAIDNGVIQLKEGNTVISSVALPVYNGGVSS